MPNSNDSERKKTTVRGRPFLKGNVKGKSASSVLDTDRHISHPKNGHGTKTAKTPIVETHETGSEKFPKINFSGDMLNPESKKDMEDTFIDTIEFFRGKDCLKIVLFKRHNRMYKIQIFLNETEIRPNTYTGSCTAMSYWKLLKENLNKEAQK